jgi:hypothetical protein
MNVPWLNNTAGNPSASLTMASVAFGTVTAWLLWWLIGTSLEYPVPSFDVGVAMAYLIPMLTLYFGRRFVEDKAPGGGEATPGEEAGSEK